MEDLSKLRQDIDRIDRQIVVSKTRGGSSTVHLDL